MKFTTEELDLVMEYSGLFMNLEDIASLLDKDLDQLRDEFQNKKGEFYKAYRKGQAISKLNLRKPVIKLASYGSPQAEMLADKYILDQKLEELDD